MKRRVADSAASTFEAVRHDDCTREFMRAAGPILRQPHVPVIEFKFPAAVQRLPLFALKLRLRVFRTRDLLRDGSDRAECKDEQLAHAAIVSGRTRTAELRRLEVQL